MGAIQKALAGKTIADNRNAFHEYFIEQRYTAGIVLSGSEVKSIRAGKAQLRGSYARIEGREGWLYDAHIAPYTQSGVYFNHDPMRKRKLLLRRKEISDIFGKITRQGYTFVPLRIFLTINSSKSNWALPKAKNNTTNAMPSPNATSNDHSTAK